MSLGRWFRHPDFWPSSFLMYRLVSNRRMTAIRTCVWYNRASSRISSCISQIVWLFRISNSRKWCVSAGPLYGYGLQTGIHVNPVDALWRELCATLGFWRKRSRRFGLTGWILLEYRRKRVWIRCYDLFFRAARCWYWVNPLVIFESYCFSRRRM